MFSLSDYHVSREYGFLPPDGNAEELPAECAAWDAIARNLPSLILEGAVRERVHALPVIDASSLKDDRHIRRGYSILAMITSAYVAGKGEDDRPRSLPKQLAVPLTHLARSLGLPPILTHSGVVLWNWRRIDPAKPPVVENVRSITMMGGGSDEEWFFMLTVQLEYEGARAIASIYDALSAVLSWEALPDAGAREKELPGLVSALSLQLQAVSDVLLQLTATIRRMREGNDPMVDEGEESHGEGGGG